MPLEAYRVAFSLWWAPYQWAPAPTHELSHKPGQTCSTQEVSNATGCSGMLRISNT